MEANILTFDSFFTEAFYEFFANATETRIVMFITFVLVLVWLSKSLFKGVKNQKTQVEVLSQLHSLLDLYIHSISKKITEQSASIENHRRESEREHDDIKRTLEVIRKEVVNSKVRCIQHQAFLGIKKEGEDGE